MNKAAAVILTMRPGGSEQTCSYCTMFLSSRNC